MYTSNWFDDQPVIGKLPPEQAAARLREIGENEAADMLEVAQDAPAKAFFDLRGPKSRWPFQDNPGNTPPTPSATLLPPFQVAIPNPFIQSGIYHLTSPSRTPVLRLPSTACA